MILDSFLDAILDTSRIVPFLFAAFLALEALEHYSGGFMNRALGKASKAGPALGALFGCVPQCGFSAAAANLYAGGVISLGTLLAVFLSTSDEAVLILLGHPQSRLLIGQLLLGKVLFGIGIGYAVDLLFRRKREEKHIEDLCHGCGCSDHSGILRPALRHTLKLTIYVFVFNFGLNLLLSFIGMDRLSLLLGKDRLFQPFITALLGLIPNCASSIFITELYLAGGLSAAAAMAGLCAGAGVGLVVLFRENRPVRQNFQILGLLYLSSALVGLVLELIMR